MYYLIFYYTITNIIVRYEYEVLYLCNPDHYLVVFGKNESQKIAICILDVFKYEYYKIILLRNIQ